MPAGVAPTLSNPLVIVSIIAWVLLLAALVWALATRRTVGPRRPEIRIIAVALGLAMVSGFLGYVLVVSFVNENTWRFSYRVSVDGNGTAPEAIIAPAVEDETLLGTLHLSAGSANWSFVDTAKGRGLYVQFVGSAVLEASLSQFPSPAVPPDTSITMRDLTNDPYWGRIWMFYSGAAGARASLDVGGAHFSGYLATGWASYELLPVPVP